MLKNGHSNQGRGLGFCGNAAASYSSCFLTGLKKARNDDDDDDRNKNKNIFFCHQRQVSDLKIGVAQNTGVDRCIYLEMDWSPLLGAIEEEEGA